MNDRGPTTAPTPQTGVYGSDRWHTMAGAEWSYWDLWFCTICVGDHDGDWDKLDAAIQQTQRWCRESLWCHLVDLTARLDAAGLTAADLPAACPTRRGLLTKARTKVLKSSPGGRELTPPMRDLPSIRLFRRALFGAWEHFPQSPQLWYESLEARFNLEQRPNGDGWATQELVYDISAAERRFIDRVRGDPAGILAVRRATLTFYFLVAQDFDDSYGAVGEVAADAVKTYAGLDWRSTGIAPEVFWRDLLEWSTQADDYGLLNQVEIDVLRTAGVARDLNLVDTILSGLASEYTAARQTGHAGECNQLRAWAVVAAEAFDRFEATVTANGTPRWTVLTSMIDAATARDRFDLATHLLDLADTTAAASRHRDWVHQHRTYLSARATGEDPAMTRTSPGP